MYGLMILIGTVSSLLLAERLARKRNLDSQIFWECAFWVILAGIIGARVWHVIDLWEVYSTDIPAAFSIWNGGLSIFGALIAGILTAVIFLQHKKQNAYEWLDTFSVVAPLGQAIGRWGNVFNNELMPFAIYESAVDFLLFGLIYFIYTRKPRAGIVTVAYLSIYLLIRIILQPFRS